MTATLQQQSCMSPYTWKELDFFIYTMINGQVKLFMKFWRSQTTTVGKLLRIAIAWAQLGAGTQSPILEDTSTKLPHLEAEWILSLRQFSQDVQGQLELDTPFVTKLQHQGDAFLMDEAIQSGKFKPTQLRRLNY
jgi:hypothetical protein